MPPFSPLNWLLTFVVVLSPVTWLCPVRVPVGGWWRLSGCCLCRSHSSKSMKKTDTFSSRKEWIFWCMCFLLVTTGRQCCSARLCAMRGSSGAFRQPSFFARGCWRTHTPLWTRCVRKLAAKNFEKPQHLYFSICKDLFLLFLFRSAISSSGVTSQPESILLWPSHCVRKRSASWEAVWWNYK